MIFGAFRIHISKILISEGFVSNFSKFHREPSAKCYTSVLIRKKSNIKRKSRHLRNTFQIHTHTQTQNVCSTKQKQFLSNTCSAAHTFFMTMKPFFILIFLWLLFVSKCRRNDATTCDVYGVSNFSARNERIFGGEMNFGMMRSTRQI